MRPPQLAASLFSNPGAMSASDAVDGSFTISTFMIFSKFDLSMAIPAMDYRSVT
jgi:hypothetical protein